MKEPFWAPGLSRKASKTCCHFIRRPRQKSIEPELRTETGATSARRPRKRAAIGGDASATTRDWTRYDLNLNRPRGLGIKKKKI